MCARGSAVSALVVAASGLCVSVAGAAEGSPDPSFGNGGATYQLGFGDYSPASEFHGVAVSQAGSIYADGVSLTGGGQFLVLVARATEAGELDPAFGTDGALISEPVDEQATRVQDEYANAISLEPDEDVIAAGNVIERVTPAGALDASFVPTGARLHVFALLRLGDGDLALVGDQPDESKVEPASVEVELPDGQPNLAFGREGLMTLPNHPGEYSTMVPSSIVELADGELLVAGYGAWAYDGNEPAHAILWLARLEASGALDPSFGEGGIAYLESLYGAPVTDTDAPPLLEPRPDGLVLLTSTPTGVEGDKQMVAWGLTGMGTPDPSYGAGGLTRLPIASGYDTANLTAATSDAVGRLLVAGSIAGRSDQGSELTPRPELVRLSAEGQPEAGFGQEGVALGPPSSSFNALAVDGSGRILAAGSEGREAMIERFLAEPSAPAPGPAQAPGQVAGARPGGGLTPAALARVLAARFASAVKRLTILWLRRHHFFSVALTLPLAGAAAVDWRVPVRVRHGRRVMRRWILIASGHGTTGAHGRLALRMRLTTRGIALLHARRRGLWFTATVSLDTPSDGAVHEKQWLWLALR